MDPGRSSCPHCPDRSREDGVGYARAACMDCREDRTAGSLADEHCRDAVGHHHGERQPPRYHRIRGRRCSVRVHYFNRRAVDLLHEPERSGYQASSVLQRVAALEDVSRIVPYMQGQVAGTVICERHAHTGTDFFPPKE